MKNKEDNKSYSTSRTPIERDPLENNLDSLWDFIKEKRE